MTRTRTQVGDRRRRPGRADARAPAAPRGHRVGRAREPRAATTSSSACAPACWSRARSTCSSRAGRRASGWTARGSCTAASSCSSTASATASTSATLTGGRTHHRLRAEGGGQGPDRRAPRGRRAAAVRGRATCRCTSSTASSPRVTFRHDGATHELECDVIAGCDGFHGVCRAADPARRAAEYEREYPFAWLGILADVAPVHRRARSTPTTSAASRCTACARRRSAASTSRCRPTRTRRVARRADLGGAADAARRCDGWTLHEGPIAREGRHRRCAASSSSRCSYGRLFLAGDAAHIVPPTGAKGLNLAVADVRVLADALAAWYAHGRRGAARRLLGALPAPRLARRSTSRGG